MTISLPVEKMANISAFEPDLLTRKVCPICDVMRISGLIVSSFLAVLPSKLHYRALEHLKIASLENKYNNHYGRSVVLTAEARSDLHWWVVNATNENGVFFTAAMLVFQFKRILIRLFCLEHELLPAWGMRANAL
jgi:hypothetical protein